MSVTNVAQGEFVGREFDSPETLVAGITAMGLRPRMIAQHGTIENFMKVAGRELAVRHSTRFD